MHTRRTSYEFSQNRTLWEVDDNFIDNPEQKFMKDHSPLVETTVEQWGCYQFDNIRDVPADLVKFVTNFTGMLGIQHSQYTSVKDICESILHRIDYEDPYFFLVDMLIQSSHNELAHTYRHRATGDILNPSQIETFRLVRGWTFAPFYTVRNIMEHPNMVEFLRSDRVPPGFSSRDEALIALFKKISTVVWGDLDWVEHMVEEAMNNHAEAMIYSEKIDDRESHTVRADIGDDTLFWMAGTLGVITWFRGPNALPFLVDYHSVYDQLLCHEEDGRIIPWSDMRNPNGSPHQHGGTGDEVIVDGQNLYTHKHLEFLPNRKADVCLRCGAEAHCTKLLNITSLIHPTCSCGRTLDPTVADEPYGYHNSRDCQPYKKAHPPRVGFVCQRCIFMTINQLGDHTKCGRTICPAVTCPHHMGPHARIQALTHQRTKQLTAPRQS